MKLKNVLIVVKDIERARQFYQQLRHIEKRHFPAKSGRWVSKSYCSLFLEIEEKE